MADTEVFPVPEAVESPPVRRRKDNPAIEFVRNAEGQGWQRITVAGPKEASRRRGQITSAGKDLGLKARTRTDDPEYPTQLFFIVGEDSQ